MYTHSQVCMYPAQVEQTGSGVSSEVGRRTHYSAYGGNLIFASGQNTGYFPMDYGHAPLLLRMACYVTMEMISYPI